MKLLQAIFLATTFIMISISIQAQTQKSTEPTTLRASSSATATATPDGIDMVVMLRSEADTPQNAVAKCTAQYDKIVDVFRKHLGNDVQFEKPEIGFPYAAYNTPAPNYVQGQAILHLTTLTQTATSHLMDACAEANIQQPMMTYRSSQEDKARNEAVRQATIKAKERAETMASALGLKVLRIVSIEDATPPGMNTLYATPMVVGGVPGGIPGGGGPIYGKGTGGGPYITDAAGRAIPLGLPSGTLGPSISNQPFSPGYTSTATPNLSGFSQGITITAIVTIIVEVGK